MMLRNSWTCGLSAPSAAVTGSTAALVDARRLARIDRQILIEVPQHDHAVAERELQLAALEDVAVLIAQDRQEQLGVELRLDGTPVDVEEDRGGRAGTVLEQIVPPGVGAGPDAHVVRHEVDDVPHAVRGNRRRERRVRLGAAHLRIDFVVVGDVVAVRAAGRRGEIRRRVAGIDAETREVRTTSRAAVSGNAAMDLQPVRAGRHIGRPVDAQC